MRLDSSLLILCVNSSEPWDFSEPFDYIHTKTTGACWESYETQIAKQAFDTLSPGGWFESQESLTTPKCDDGTFKEDSALSLWFLDFTDAAAEAKRPLTEAANLKSMYERVGFVDIHERIFKVPLNGWPKDMELKEVGLMMEMNMQMGLSAFSLSLFNRIYRQTPAEIEVRRFDNFSSPRWTRQVNMANTVATPRYPLWMCGEKYRIPRFTHICPFTSSGAENHFQENSEKEKRDTSPFVFSPEFIFEDTIGRDTWR